MNRIAFLIPGLDRIGGAERQLMLLAKGLARRGWQVSVVALTGSGGNAASELAAAGVGFVTLHMRKGLADPRGWLRFHRWLKRESPDVVHAHLPHAAWLARWSRLATPVRVLVDRLHSFSTGTLGRRLGYRFSNWLADTVIAVSNPVTEAHLAARMASASKLIVLPNGVDVSAWHPDPEGRAALRRELGIEAEFLWLAAGRLEPVKDYPALLKAFAQLPSQPRLVIAGSGPLQGELHHLAAQLGLVDRVQFLGFEPELRPWMQTADGFVLSSLWEGLPMAVLEAAACALPAVATDVPGTREAIVDGQTGFLAEPGSIRALTDSMVRLMRIPAEERAAMGQRARRRVIEQFSLEAGLDRWEALYAVLLQQNPKPRRWARTTPGQQAPKISAPSAACEDASLAAARAPRTHKAAR